jgi:hypothetical protein
MDSYNSFLSEGVINMNAGDAEDYKMTDDEVNHHIIGVVMAQHFSLKAGLKKFGVPGEEATTKELTQLHDMVTFIPMDPTKLSRADRLKALSSLMFLIEKRDGTIKGRACADGSKQRRDESYNKHDNASPTCANNSICHAHKLK